ncbi:MAG: GntR family transcriptional regulator [Glaciecola sp.]
MVAASLWQQVLTDLERRIEDGELTDRFPTDRELVDTYGVSRHTVREAVRRLRAQGVIERHRGRGSFLRGREFTAPAGALYSLFRAVEAAGLPQHSEVLSFTTDTDPEAAGHLGLAPDSPLVRLERLRFAGDEPLAMDIAWLPFSVAEPLLEVDFGRTALYDELDRRCGIRLTGGQEIIEPIVPDADLRSTLGLEPREGVFRVERQGRVGDVVVEWRVTLIRGGRFSLVSQLDPSADQHLQMIQRTGT